MNQKQDIEARLERSLRRQVAAPTLDGRFNAAVWSRIAAQGQKAAPMVIRRRTPGWLTACNIVGAIVSVLALGYYAARSVTGLDLGFELPSFSADQQTALINNLAPYISGVAVLFGLMFTRPARKLLKFMF
jgi:hypothetical protein